MEENKVQICAQLTETLKLTRQFSDLEGIALENNEGTAVVHWKGGFESRVNITCDSGSAMIRDILKAIS